MVLKLSFSLPCNVCVCADLLGKLSGERSRWEQQLSELDGQLAQLPSAALLLAAFITYLPAHPEDVKDRVLPVWSRWESWPHQTVVLFWVFRTAFGPTS